MTQNLFPCYHGEFFPRLTADVMQLVSVTDIVYFCFAKDGFIHFFNREDGQPDNGRSGWRVAAVAGLGLGALLMLACR